ncbi:ornithine cyclodeaminase family protein [Streptomyces daliensis]|uniref:Ornithine cyclodeaminase family protein n=1 Tax=Streptomyces daliensis TaxID=299421 RepID=A0A8T4IVF2_9ACTN|nr:ornithine cyclodeaminase family protein [Streptomyces daliensis]
MDDDHGIHGASGADGVGADGAGEGAREAAPVTRPVFLGDEDVRARLDAPTAVAAVRHALLAHHAGRLHAPPRLHAPVGLVGAPGPGELVFTAGGLEGERALYGFRAYATGHGGGQQIVAVWSAEEGLLGVVHGAELGPRRTGAIGAVAVDALARPDATHLGLIGTGPQAWAQIWAVASVRRLSRVSVYGRRAERANLFAYRIRRALGVDAHPVATPEEAVRGHGIVITATPSEVPVLEAEWVEPGTHVSALGPKSRARHEIPPALVARADAVVTDSRAQAARYGTRDGGDGDGPRDGDGPLVDPAAATELGAVLAGAVPARTGPGQVTLFCSVGLAGTEVAVAATLMG